MYVKKGRQPQKYRVKYDGGQTMTSLEEQMELTALEEDDSDQSSAIDEMKGSDYEGSEGSESTVEVERMLGQAREDEEEGGNVTEDSDGENGEDRPLDDRDAMESLKVGNTVEAQGFTWEMREDLTTDCRNEQEIESTFANIRFDESTHEGSGRVSATTATTEREIVGDSESYGRQATLGNRAHRSSLMHYFWCCAV